MPVCFKLIISGSNAKNKLINFKKSLTRQSVRCGLDDRQAEGLLQRAVDEHATCRQAVPVDVGHLGGAVLLGVGHRAVQVQGVHQLEHLGAEMSDRCSQSS